MKRQSCVAALLGLLLGSWVGAEPVAGPSARKYEIGGAVDGDPGVQELALKFQGGKRACVSVRGDHEPVVPLDITVIDKEGAIVVRDESAKDFVAVFWTPPRTAEYRIVVRNHGRDYNIVYMVCK